MKTPKESFVYSAGSGIRNTENKVPYVRLAL